VKLAELPLRLARRLPPRARRVINLARGIDVPELMQRPPGRRVVVVAPHPDDELLGCGATLRKHLDGGDELWVAFVTSGERTAALSLLPLDARVERREADARAAAAVLGLAGDHLEFLRYPDGGVASRPPAGRSVADMLRAHQPDLVYVPFPYEPHTDHEATARLVAAALPDLPSVKTVALYEVWTPVSANCIVDVTEQFERKIEALGCYTSALESVDYCHTARGLAAYRSGAGLHGHGYAEAFLLLRPDELRSLEL
jgi:LmbE family N-acetylglucosaminyl deacetylase